MSRLASESTLVAMAATASALNLPHVKRSAISWTCSVVVVPLGLKLRYPTDSVKEW